MRKWITIFMLALLVSCNNETVYHKFVSIEDGEWTKSDKLTFEVGPIHSDMTVEESVELRLWTREYPYGNISILVEQTLYPAKTKTIDTLTYFIRGKEQGARDNTDGPAFYQVSMPLKTLSLHKGDSLSVRLRHNMKRVELPGVVDVGLKIE